MASSIAGVFWRAARAGALAYGHTRTHFLEGGRGGRLISPAGPREGGRGGGTTSLKGGYGPPGWQKNPTLVDCVDRFYVAARRSTGYGYTNSRSCSAAAIPASLAALECRFRLSLPPGHPLLTAAHTLTPRLQCCEYLPQRCTTLLRSAANGLTYRELPSAHTLQRRR